MEVQAKSKQGTPVNGGGNSQMEVRKTKLAEINVGRERGKEEGEWGGYI